ncbi:hypothetical protein GCM10007973_16580 [Polymorphobacter multimanifer]|jgi:hypothetical protein|uniref:Peptidase C39 domain-containing protein n=1 Tax=Polymorphobacter multimanifer TaxID=1070431 RepID=A0A841LJQ7_9SPHN|nr:C39 family peptidase [Polymorphobacter multimanifer]MBB6229462.1 hypothetical protein [Polymorphobacter multimanifer]GGI80770.1 hypothetical protein GCM10007973_16580 [Polymorphobacter multimanifer]
MSRSHRAELLLFVGLAGCASAAPDAGTNRLALGNLSTALPVVSMYERRFATVVRQQYDFSCGSAALATLLTYHYARPIDEQATFTGMFRTGDQAAIRRLGFSLLDMKRYLADSGFKADGYQVTLTQIAAARQPGIALIETGGYKHFVVLKGIEPGLGGDSVLLGDPATGLRRMNAAAFLKSWNGVLFVIDAGGAAVQASFARPTELALAPGGQITQQLEPLSQQALALTRPTLGDL